MNRARAAKIAFSGQRNKRKDDLTTAAAPFSIGDRLIYDGRVCLIHGFTPMGVEPARVYLSARDLAEILPVDADELEARAREPEAA